MSSTLKMSDFTFPLLLLFVACGMLLTIGLLWAERCFGVTSAPLTAERRLQYVLNTPRIVRVHWFGPEMPEIRRQSLDNIREVVGKDCIVELITEKDIEKYHALVPLHECFQYLSGIHKSDYLRGYIGHHWGGGYTDIKPYDTTWEGRFDIFEDPDVWITGAPEINRDAVGAEDP